MSDGDLYLLDEEIRRHPRCERTNVIAKRAPAVVQCAGVGSLADERDAGD